MTRISRFTRLSTFAGLLATLTGCRSHSDKTPGIVEVQIDWQPGSPVLPIARVLLADISMRNNHGVDSGAYDEEAAWRPGQPAVFDDVPPGTYDVTLPGVMNVRRTLELKPGAHRTTVVPAWAPARFRKEMIVVSLEGRSTQVEFARFPRSGPPCVEETVRVAPSDVVDAARGLLTRHAGRSSDLLEPEFPVILLMIDKLDFEPPLPIIDTLAHVERRFREHLAPMFSVTVLDAEFDSDPLRLSEAVHPLNGETCADEFARRRATVAPRIGD